MEDYEKTDASHKSYIPYIYQQVKVFRRSHRPSQVKCHPADAGVCLLNKRPGRTCASATGHDFALSV